MNRIKKIAAIVLAFLVYLSTNGVMLFEHHCGCTDQVQTHFIPLEHDCCDHDNTHKKCCDADNPKTACETGHDNNCCETNSLFLKVDIPVELPGKTSQIKNILKIETFHHDILFDDENESKDFRLDFNATPPLSGLMLKRYIVLHQLKIAPPEHS